MLFRSLADVARVELSVPEHLWKRYESALSSRITPLLFRRPRRRELWGFREMRRLSREMLEFRPDIFHLQADGVWESVLLRMIGPLPVINTIHDPVKHIDQDNFLNNFLMRDAVQHARGWVVHSEAMKRILLERFQMDPGRVLVHPHGSITYYTGFAAQGHIQREKFILFYGSVRHNKGCDVLLRAFDSVKDRLDGWKVIVAGGGDDLKDYQGLLKGLGDRLEYRNRFIEDDETADLFSRAGIVALPYRHGTQSGVLSIAASFGCPVLSTRFGGMAELVQDRQQVLFVEPESETALAQGLLELAQDEVLRTELGRNLKELSLRAWSWESIAQNTLQFYEQILSLS